MPDNRIYDAINVFKYSRTGQGTASIGGDATYRQRYRQLAQDVVTKLWELYSADEIAFAPLGPNLIGDSLPGRPGADIRVNNQLEPSANAATYATAAEQGKLAACSGNIVHEATHIVRPIASYPESEVLCRTIQLFYISGAQAGLFVSVLHHPYAMYREVTAVDPMVSIIPVAFESAGQQRPDR